MILEGQGVGLHWVQGWALKNCHLVRIRATLAVAPAKAHPFGEQHTLLLVVVGCWHFNDASTESSDSKDVLSMKSNGSRPNKENMATQ